MIVLYFYLKNEDNERSTDCGNGTLYFFEKHTINKTAKATTKTSIASVRFEGFLNLKLRTKSMPTIIERENKTHLNIFSSIVKFNKYITGRITDMEVIGNP